MTQVVTVLISLSALAVAVYGIFERRMAWYATTRVRLGELLETIQGFNIQEQEKAEEHPELVGEQLGGLFAARRALVTYQAMDLLRRLERVPRWLSKDSHLTAEEHNALAWSLMSLRDFDSARTQWEAALSAEGYWPPQVRAGSHNGYAECLAANGDLDGMRREYRAAAETYPENLLGKWDAFYTYLTWIWAEWRWGGSRAGEARAAAEQVIGTMPPASEIRDRAESLLNDALRERAPAADATEHVASTA